MDKIQIAKQNTAVSSGFYKPILDNILMQMAGSIPGLSGRAPVQTLSISSTDAKFAIPIMNSNYRLDVEFNLEHGANTVDCTLFLVNIGDAVGDDEEQVREIPLTVEMNPSVKGIGPNIIRVLNKAIEDGE